MKFKKKSVKEIDALWQENVGLRRKVEAKGVTDKGKEKEIIENGGSVHKVTSLLRVMREAEKESDDKIGGATNNSLAT